MNFRLFTIYWTSENGLCSKSQANFVFFEIKKKSNTYIVYWLLSFKVHRSLEHMWHYILQSLLFETMQNASEKG